MRRNNTQPLKTIIESFIKEMKLEQKLKEADIVSCWEEIVGKTVAKNTRSIYIKNKVLFVHLNSSVIRHELSMLKTSLIEAVNKRSGEQLISDIVLR